MDGLELTKEAIYSQDTFETSLPTDHDPVIAGGVYISTPGYLVLTTSNCVFTGF